MRKILIILPIMFIVFASATVPSFATSTFCAVTEKTYDGFVSVRSGPGITFQILGKAYPNDFLYVGTEKCRSDFGPLLCSNNHQWVFVEEISGRAVSSKLKGWVRESLIRQVNCPHE